MLKTSTINKTAKYEKCFRKTEMFKLFWKKKKKPHCDEIGHENLHLNTEGVRKERMKKLFVKNMYFYKISVNNSK